MGFTKLLKTMFFGIALVTSVAMVSGLAGYSGCNGGAQKSLTITAPVNDATISPADDVSDTSGIQINVTATVEGFQRGDLLYLRMVDASGFESALERRYDSSGTVTFTSVTFVAGTVDNPMNYALTITDASRDVISNAVQIHVVETGECSPVTWIDPVDGFAWNITDDANDDISDGFQHNVEIMVVAPSSTVVSLYINNSIAGTISVQDNLARFEDIDFPTVFDLTIELRKGETCTYDITGTLDLDVPECQITQPVDTPWLNLNDDVDAASAGIQIDAVVTSNNATEGELLVDDASVATVSFSGNQATFPSVDMDDAALGGRCLRAICTDAGGNRGFSGTSCFGVDSVPPTINITRPAAGAFFNDASDVNTDETGIQVEVDVTSDQLSTIVEIWNSAAADCSGVPSPLSPEGTPTTDASGNATGQVSLGAVDGDVNVCARVTKPSGNFGNAGVTVTVDNAAPGIRIVRPDGYIPDPIPTPPPVDADDSLILMVDDEVPYNASTNPNYEANYTVLVDCEVVGRPVDLYRASTETEIGILRGTDTCEACTGSETPACTLPGRATFPQLQLIQTGIGVEYEYAMQTDATGNPSIRQNVPIIVDTYPPQPNITQPTCGSTLHLTPPYSQRVVVAVGESGTTDVTLNVYDSGGNPVSGSPYTMPNSAGFAVFNTVTLVDGANRIEACTRDLYDQSGCNATCTVTVSNLPAITFVSPTDGVTLGAADDLDGNPANGIQINVTFTADVADGSATRLEVNGTAAGTQSYTAGGVTYTSITITEGTGIAIMGCATDVRGEGCNTIHVSIDLTPPGSINDLSLTVLDRRAGRMRLDWTAPSDGGATVAGYDVRCDNFDITEGNFTTARSFTFTGVPASPGSAETTQVSGLFVGLTTNYRCAVKSVDNAGNMSAISNVPAQPLILRSVEISGPTGTTDQYGYSADALGDINGDGFEDFIVGSYQSRVQIFLGSSAADISTTPNITINGPVGTNFGASVAGIGNFDGDAGGLTDFAIGAYGANALKGEVYVFLGRNTWLNTSTYTLSSTDANMRITMDDPSGTSDDSAYFGFDVSTAGDFNGDGRNDLLIGAGGWAAFSGSAFIILGRTTPPATLTVPGDRTTNFIGDFMLTAPAGGQFGSACDLVGMVSADSYADIVVAAPMTSSGGSVYLFYGRSAAGSGLSEVASASKTINSPAASIRFGNDVAGAGDINGDGRMDLVVGAPRYPDGTNRYGAVYVYLHSGTEIDETYDSMITNSAASPANDFFGLYLARSMNMSYATTGTLDASISDIIVGGSRFDVGSGRSFLFLGSSTFNPGTTAGANLEFIVPGTDPGNIDSRPRYIGDINNDGFADLSIAFAQNNTNQGKVVVYY